MGALGDVQWYADAVADAAADVGAVMTVDAAADRRPA